MGTFFPLSKFATATALHVSELLLLAFGLLLVVGLVGEIAKSPKWKSHLRKFELMVVIGVAGELVADGGMFVFSKRLQAISDSEVAVLTKETAETRERASANELVSKKLGIELETAKTENLKLQSLIQPRSLTVSQQRQIGDSIRRFSGRKIVAYSGSYDHEGYFFSKQIVAALKYGGLDVDDRSGGNIGSQGAPLSGVVITRSRSEKDIAEVISKSLRTIGKVEQVTIHEGHGTISTTSGSIEDPRPILWVSVFAKPLPTISPSINGVRKR